MKESFRFAFLKTIPVMLGYLFLGLAFGLLLQEAGYSFWWAFLISTIVYAGSIQFVLVSFLTAGTSLPVVAVMTLLINSRHAFYGLTFIEKFKAMKSRPYMIFSLTDETYALLSSARVPERVDPHAYYFAIAVLDHGYWILGSVIGSVAGALISFDTTGIDFAMTALFIVIAVDQWKTYRSHLPALLGCGITVLSLVILRPDAMLIPALCVIIVALLLLRARLEGSRTEAEEEVV